MNASIEPGQPRGDRREVPVWERATPLPPGDRPRLRDVLRRLWFRAVVGVVGACAGAMLSLLVALVGHCSFVGGRCPATPPPPLWQDDVAGGLVVGLGVMVWSVVLAIRPDRRGVVVALVVQGVVAVPLAITIARGAHLGTW
jgi:hypothetical protein